VTLDSRGLQRLRHERSWKSWHATRGSRGAAGLELMSETDEPKERKAQGTEFEERLREGSPQAPARIGCRVLLSMKNRLAPAPFAERLAGRMIEEMRSEGRS